MGAAVACHICRASGRLELWSCPGSGTEEQLPGRALLQMLEDAMGAFVSMHGPSRKSTRQPARSSCAPVATAARPCTAPVRTRQPSSISLGPSASAAALTAVCAGSAFESMPMCHAALLEAKAVHRMRVQALVKQRRHDRKGFSYPHHARAEDRVLQDFWDPRAREKIVVATVEARGGELVVEQRGAARAVRQAVAVRPSSAPAPHACADTAAAAVEAKAGVPAAPQQQHRYQSPDLWLLDATGTKADAVRTLHGRKARPLASGHAAAQRAGELSRTSARCRSGMLHSRYKAMYHPMADHLLHGVGAKGHGAVPGHLGPAGGQSQHCAQPWQLSGASAVLQRLRHVQQRRLQQGPRICD
eukprot:jgi/Ulvmu1/5051/UM021_0068.1